MNKKDFLENVDKAINYGWGIKVFVNMPDLPKPEIICNPPENVPGKREYYAKAYDDDMRLETFDQISISAIQFLNLK